MKKEFDFIKIQKYTIVLSLIVIFIGLWSIFGPAKLNLGIATPKGFNLGIDFQGGLSQIISVYSGVSIEEMRGFSTEVGLGDDIQEVIVSSDERLGEKSTFIIKTLITAEEQAEIDEKSKDDPSFTSARFLKDKTEALFATIHKLHGDTVTYTNEDFEKAVAMKKSGAIINGELSFSDETIVVSNVVVESANTISQAYSSKMRKDAVLLIGFVLLIMLAYVSWRFKFEFAVGAVVALLHDTLMMLTFISLTGTEFDLTVVAAILTIIGYSVNDTIVVFDRVRENLSIMKETLPNKLFNTSINQTLNRTIITSVTTILSVVALYVWGGPKIHSFSFVLLVGLIVGTYSSIFIASPVVLIMTKLISKDKKKYKKLEEKAEKEEKKSQENENLTVEENSVKEEVVVSKKTLLKLQGKKKK